MLAINSFLSITAPVLFVSSHTTLKSVIPRRPCISLKNGSTTLTNSALVNSSLNSNITFFAALDIALSTTKNNRRTLILSNALGRPKNVLSPNRSTPWPVPLGQPSCGPWSVTWPNKSIPILRNFRSLNVPNATSKNLKGSSLFLSLASTLASQAG